jgi:hypothetical protein
LFYQLKEHTLCPLVQIGKITVQLAGGQQLRIERLSVLPEKPLVPLRSSRLWESWHGHILFGRSFSFLLKWHFHLFGQIEKADLHNPLPKG